MLGMTRGLVLHNAMQLSIPFWLTAIMLNNFPRLDFLMVGFWAVMGTVVPDFDHFSMWNRVKHKGFFSFVKFMVQADRYRKAFLPFHNYVAMLVVAVTAALFSGVNLYVSVFFTAFLVHLIFDFIADLYLIKQHTHWWIRNWFNANGNSQIISNVQRAQRSDRQK